MEDEFEMPEVEKETQREDLRRAAFNLAWGMLSCMGECDEAFGAQYRRVYATWVEAGHPQQVAAFIRERGNQRPGPPPLPAAETRPPGGG
jgi:hypothetical protein